MRRQRISGSIVATWCVWLAAVTFMAAAQDKTDTAPVIGNFSPTLVDDEETTIGPHYIMIGDIPPPIVGDGDFNTTTGLFVYPDAINLYAYVTDDRGMERIVWSYEVAGEPIYSINGTDPIDSATESPVDPAAVGKDLNTVRNDEDNPDGVAQTITIRNVHLSPLGGPNLDPETEGILASETQVVTLYAANGTTYGQKEIMIYTDNEGEDRLSPFTETVYAADFTNDANGFTSMEINSATATVGSNGLCIEVAAYNTNIGAWTSPYPLFEMAANSVYRVRANMNGSQTDHWQVPMWDIIIQNFDNNTGTQGANAFLTDYWFVSNEGGANAVGPASGITGVELYFVPLPAKLPSWMDATTGAFTPANDPRNDVQIVFRILDPDDYYGGYDGWLTRHGQICLQTMTIDRFDLDTAVTEGETVMDLAINATNYRGEDLLDSSTFDWGTAGELTFGPTDGNFETELSYLQPGDGDHMGVGGSGAADDDFPIVWEDDTIYMVEMSVSAPTVDDEAQPNDVIQVGMDPPTWECFMLNSVTRGDSTMHNIGMPKSGTPQTYVSFFNSHQVSLSALDDFKRLRPRVQVLNTTNLSFGGPDYKPRPQNTANMTIHGITVKKVTIN